MLAAGCEAPSAPRPCLVPFTIAAVLARWGIFFHRAVHYEGLDRGRDGPSASAGTTRSATSPCSFGVARYSPTLLWFGIGLGWLKRHCHARRLQTLINRRGDDAPRKKGRQAWLIISRAICSRSATATRSVPAGS